MRPMLIARALLGEPKSLPKMISTPCTGNTGLTPIATSPCTKPHMRNILCTGTGNTLIPIPRMRSLSPVSVTSENGKMDARMYELEAPVSLRILTGTLVSPPTSDTNPSVTNGR
ncbi:unnamed protein product [Arctogadus glacialis]